MQRIDTSHELRRPRVGNPLPTPAEVEQFRDLLIADEWAMPELVEQVERSPELRRAVMRIVYSADVAIGLPVEGTWHALALLGTRRLQRLAEQLLRDLASAAANVGS